MKKILILAVILVNQALAEPFPQRQPGLWEMEINLSSIPVTQKMKVCVDRETDSKLLGLSQDIPCSRRDNFREGDKFILETECTFFGSKADIRTVASGDFKSSFTMEVSSKFDPPLEGQSESRQTIKGRWLGPCGAGQKPGEAIMEDGTKINLIDTKQ